MPDILDLVEPGTLEQTPPRRLPVFFLPNLIGEYLLERPPRTYLNPYVLTCLIGAVTLTLLEAPRVLGLALLALAGLRLLRPALLLYRDVREDYLLMRHGVIVTAHILGVRPFSDTAGNPAGAYLDCAVPVNRQRTSVGSIWVADMAEAMRLSALGRLTVICLPRSPGTWRLYRRPGAALML